jgi:DNA-binding response OmpR family regulator
LTFAAAPSPAANVPEALTPARILIVEDNADLAFGLRRTLEANGYEVDAAQDGADALRRARVFQPQLILLDLMMPGMDGFSVLASLRAEGVTAPVLILSAKADESDKVRGFRTGADDFVTKPFGVLELLARVSALLRRTAPPASDAAPAPAAATLAFGGLEIDVPARRVTRDGAPVAMAPKEFDLLVALARHPGTALSRTRLLREVWGHAPDVQTRTVDIHIVELRRKLEPEPARPRHIVTVWKTGYRLDP